MVTQVACPFCRQRCQVEVSQRGQPQTCLSCGRTYVPKIIANESAPATSHAGTASAAAAGEPKSPPLQLADAPWAPPQAVEQLPHDAQQLPKRIGRFRIRRLLGAGAYGTVYLAEDPVLARYVALKVLRSDASGGGKARARFLREAKAAAQLHHPNIIPVFDAGTDDQVDYLAAKYIQGRTLEDELQHHRADWDWAADVCRRLADALAYAHGQGIVHRDVKSNNVMVDGNGDVHLTDFGLAHRLGSDEKLTKDGAILGTAAYMAPEQASSEFGSVGPYSDQYSLGIILYELLCGEPPFSGPVAVVLYNCVHTEPAAPHTIVPDIPRDLEAVCLKAIAKRPEDRYADCEELAEDLRRWLADEPLVARPIGPVERLGRWTQRNPVIASLIAAVAVLLITVASVATVSYWRLAAISGERDEVTKELEDKRSELEKVTSDVQQREGELQVIRGNLDDTSEKLQKAKGEIDAKKGDIAKAQQKLKELEIEATQKPAQYLKQRLLKAIQNNTREADEPTGDPEPRDHDSIEPDGDLSPCAAEQRVRIYLAQMQAHRLGINLPPVHNRGNHANVHAERDFALYEGNDIKQWWYDALWSWDPNLWTSVEPHLPGPVSRWDPAWGPTTNTTVNAPPIESLASHVPEECFYVRFSDFKELLWFLDNAEFVSDALLRSGMTGHLAGETGSKIVRQLALERLLSDSAGGLGQYSEVASYYISDVAVIGTDPFFQEGPAIGLVVETPQQEWVVKIVRALRGDGDPDLLKSGQGLPTELITTPLMWFLRGLFGGGIVVAADPPPAATVEPLRIEGHEVYPYPSNPDRPVDPAHRGVRSYLVADGNFVLLTNSVNLVRRFLQAGRGQGALDALPEFQAARHQISATPPVGCFAFLSDQFYENVRSPQYLIETRRRAIAAAELEMVQLAALAARSAGKPCETVELLVGQGFLPKGIGTRAGSRPEIVGNAVRDSRRGLRGTFAPVPDVQLEFVWDFEAQLAEQVAGVLPPSTWLSVTRTDSVDDQVGIQVTVGVPFSEKSAPLDQRLHGIVQMLRDWGLADHPAELLPLLAEPSRVEMSPVAGDLATLEIGFRTNAARTFTIGQCANMLNPSRCTRSTVMPSQKTVDISRSSKRAAFGSRARFPTVNGPIFLSRRPSVSRPSVFLETTDSLARDGHHCVQAVL